MSIAAGSACEVGYQLYLAMELNYIGTENYDKLDAQVNEIKRMLNTFIQKLTANCSPLQYLQKRPAPNFLQR